MPPDVPAAEPGEPWRTFLHELDATLTGPVGLRCVGGFVVAQHFGIGRSTSDIDYLVAQVASGDDDLERLAGHGSELHRRYGLYLQHVGIATPPCDYASRMVRMFPAAVWRHLTLYALDATDLALSKVERNAERDREDFIGLVQAGCINLEDFEARYFAEVRPYLLAKHEWHDATVRFWLELAASIRQVASRRS